MSHAIPARTRLRACRLRRRDGLLLLLITGWLVSPLPAQTSLLGPLKARTQAGDDTPHVRSVALLADRTAIAPGGTVNLAIHFELDSDWHLYWRNRGEGGLEPNFKWTLPEGFEVGPLRWPAPKRHVDDADAHTFILEDEPILLAELRAPAKVDAGEVTIGLNATWLVCKTQCVRGKKALSLSLPVSAEGKPANEDVFDLARARLPVPAEQAKYLKIKAVADVDKVKPGGEFKLAVVLDVEKAHHINSHRPLDKFLIATDVFHDAAEGADLGRAVFPDGKVEKVEGSAGDLSVYRDRVRVILPVQADAEIDAKELRFGGVVTYQACSDETQQCYRPMAAEWSLTLPVAGRDEQVSAANTEVFAGDGGAGENSAAGPAPGASVGTTARPLPADASWLARVQFRLESYGYIGYLLMAAIGGFILNLMPCVLPVISIKILSFVQQAREDRLRVMTLGSAFSGGILVSFLVLGGVIIGLNQQWGGLFQRPQAIIAMAAVVTALAMSLFGVFSLFPPRVINELGERVQREGHLGAFGMGLLATLLGTACTAPFLSAVVAIATRQTPVLGMLLFAAAGVGMAFPYMLLAIQPAWVRLVPRPGPWMGVFEHVVGFILLATVVWLLYPLAGQLGGQGLIWTLAFLVCVAMAAWLYGQVKYDAGLTRKLTCYPLAVALVVGGWLTFFRVATTIPELAAEQKALRQGGLAINADEVWQRGEIPWLPFTRERVIAQVNAGRTVFIDYTADWCLNCKANEKLFINTPEVRAAMQRLDVVPFQADFTLPDEQIKADLQRFGRSGVPMYVIIPGYLPDEPIVLDEILTKSSIIAGLERAESRREAAESAAVSMMLR